RGELQTIGATTLDEYRKHIEKDAALERRFQPIQVPEPSLAHSIEILKGLRDKYEAHHKVTVTDGALAAAVNMSDRYINDRYLPEKILEARHRKEAAIDAQDFELAASERDSEMKLAKEKEEQTEAWRKSGTDTSKVVDSDLIAEVLASATGIPIFKLTEEES